MPTLHNRERDSPDYRDRARDQSRNQNKEDREISLGTGTILAIFFALALVCAVFFGLGYSMGRKSLQPSVAAAAVDPTNTSTSLSNLKPAAGSPGKQPSVTPKKDSETATTSPPTDPDGEIVTKPPTAPEEPPATSRTKTQPRKESSPDLSGSSTIVRDEARPTAPQFQSTSMPPTNSNGTSMVQVAAVSHQEDADVLISALKKRGYAVFIRQEPQDQLLHVQVGPFGTKKDAEAMRQRLLSDGYNAIVK